MYSTSAGARRKLIGTRMRPQPHTPKNEVSRREALWETMATRSPRPDPQPVQAGRLGPGPVRPCSAKVSGPHGSAGWSGSSISPTRSG